VVSVAQDCTVAVGDDAQRLPNAARTSSTNASVIAGEEKTR